MPDATDESPEQRAYHVTAWCDRTFTTSFSLDAASPEEALMKAKEQAHDEPAEECDGDYPWDTFTVEDDGGVIVVREQPSSATPALLNALAEAERKSSESLARYKFLMFGYWAAIWVHLNRIEGTKRPNPWKEQVNAARLMIARHQLHTQSVTPPAGPSHYGIGVNNDDGDCYDIVIKRGDRPIATLIATEGEVESLVRAGNAYPELHNAAIEVIQDWQETSAVTPEAIARLQAAMNRGAA
jgi:hypothetical protein